MLRLGTLGLCTLTLSISTLGAVETLRLTPGARPGIFHASDSGLIVGASGAPVPGTVVTVVANLPGRGGIWGAGSTISDETGRFRVEDMNTLGKVFLSLKPPCQWIPENRVIDIVSGEHTDVGVISLRTNTTLRGILDLDGFDQEKLKKWSVHVGFESDSGKKHRKVSGKIYGDDFVINDIPFERGDLVISVRYQKETFHYRQPLELAKGEITRYLRLRVTRKTQTFEILDDSHLDDSPCEDPSVAIQGKILGPEGGPLEGVLLTAVLPGLAFGASSVSNREGVFQLSDDWEARTAGGPDAWYLGGALLLHRDEVQGVGVFRVDESDLTGFEVKITGVATEDARLCWLSGNKWLPIGGLGVWAPRDRSPLLLRLQVRGFIPQVRFLEGTRDASESDDEEAPKESVLVEFRFDRETERSLFIRGELGPIPEARVDIDQMIGGDNPARLPLGSWKTDKAGHLTLKGMIDGEGYLQAYIYAPGYAAATSLWHAGEHRTIVLAKRSGRILVPEMPKGYRLRLREAGGGDVGSVVYGGATSATIALAPRDYDAVFLDESNQVKRTSQFRLEKDQVVTVPIEGDDRPRVIVRAPGAWGSEWGALATRSTPSHGPFRPSASSTFFSAFEVDEPPSQVERISQQQVKLICSGTGKYTVLVWSGVLPYSLSKEVVLPARGKVELEVPPIDAILVGSMNSYGGGKGHSPDHGWAAPRLILLSRKNSGVAEGWDIIVSIPERFEDDFFELAVPAGKYHLFQHLIGEPQQRTYRGKTVETYRAAYGYGGIPLRLRSGEILRLVDFVEAPLQSLEVEVVDHAGVPLSNGILSIRDRMAEAWRIVELGGSTLAYAPDRIPMPPERRLRNGRVTFPAVRQGFLELQLLSGGDRIHRFSVSVHPGQPLRLQLPASDHDQ